MSQTQLRNALWALRHGFKIFPLQMGGKNPNGFLVPHGCIDSTTDEAMVRQWWAKSPNSNVGIHGGVIVDCDTGISSLQEAETWCGKVGLPRTLTIRTGRRSSYGVQFHFKGQTNTSPYDVSGVSGEVRSGNAYGLAPGSIHPDTGQLYEVVVDAPIADFPVGCLLEREREKTRKSLERKPNPKNGSKIKASFRQYWLVSQGGRLRNAGLSGQSLFAALRSLCDTYCENAHEKSDDMLRQICESGERNYGVKLPKENGEPGSTREDTSNARRFADRHSDKVRYWHGRNKWILWTGTHWQDDELGEVAELAKETARSIYEEAATLPNNDGGEHGKSSAEKMGGWATTSMQKEKILAMLLLAKSEPRIRIGTESFDTDPWALNFLNGTIDLRTGILKPHNPSDYITKVLECEYDPEAESILWNQFLIETFRVENFPYIQRAVGYSITGITSEKCVFVPYGPTDTGKSTFLQTLYSTFEAYSAVLQIDTLMWSKGADNNMSADLADLRGARLVITSETEEGQRLREAKIKRITQGMGKIKTARKYENPITFQETHKLWIDCNHLPILSGTDDAIWNRLHPIPCLHKLEANQKDRELKNKLLLHRDAISAWAVKGALLWLKDGLLQTQTIIEQRKNWRAGIDLLGRFLEDRCTFGTDSAVKASDLYAAFRLFTEAQGEFLITSTAFGLRMSEKLDALGVQKTRLGGGMAYFGLTLNA